MAHVMIVVGSVRPGRIGLPIAEWVRSRVEEAGHDVDFADLKELALPFLDEPSHPIKRDYQHAHTRVWSARVDAADALIFVTPEYNHSYSPALKNAIDYLYTEWQAKPVGFVSYGGQAGGLRGVNSIEPVLSSVGLVKVPTEVALSGAAKQVQDGAFAADERQANGLDALIAQVVAYGEALRPLQARS
ncbi:NAD(P)H-dependent FMN reductase [Microcella putealis]|uniref:NAD(P)H-dependent FMN reductase n=1 Tax=Microcella putealis TaxID=337005 RepID=A0A4Q7LY07_9MICO|nr:NAD(P)H-dependent oxidoreductase [Microcella putealis]RZS59674.1 NAD(P)H-dependent FMN reductase [Microcella putealis]TQM26787.1 NAD(P)H-dependent FMN reductase [Microcella putealis]